jgi:hypothetical protein
MILLRPPGGAFSSLAFDSVGLGTIRMSDWPCWRPQQKLKPVVLVQ